MIITTLLVKLMIIFKSPSTVEIKKESNWYHGSVAETCNTCYFTGQCSVILECSCLEFLKSLRKNEMMRKYLTICTSCKYINIQDKSFRI